MGRGIILLLLVIPLAVVTALSSPSTRIEESFVGEKSNSISSSVAALDFGSSSAQHELQQAPDAAEATPPSARGHGLHVEPGMLFTRKSLLPGTVLPEGTKFGGDGGFPDPERFVLRADADAIPFSSSQLDTILRLFRIPRGSKKAEQVAATLRTCEADESPDPHTCATSEQAAADFAAAALGVRTREELAAVVTVVHGSKDAARYVVAPGGVARVGKEGAAAAVPCHPMAYPYMVHYCHRPADVKALRVELTGLGGDGGGATAIAMCHANTTSWDGRYFEMLNATRGEEICHFMPRNYVLWLPAGCRPAAVEQAGRQARRSAE